MRQLATAQSNCLQNEALLSRYEAEGTLSMCRRIYTQTWVRFYPICSRVALFVYSFQSDTKSIRTVEFRWAHEDQFVTDSVQLQRDVIIMFFEEIILYNPCTTEQKNTTRLSPNKKGRSFLIVSTKTILRGPKKHKSTKTQKSKKMRNNYCFCAFRHWIK